MAPQQCPICKRDHVEATHKNFPAKKTTGEKVKKVPAKSELKLKKKTSARRLDLSGSESESEKDSREWYRRSKSKTKLEKLRRLMQSSDSSDTEGESSAESSRVVKVEIRGATAVENPTFRVDVWRKLTGKDSASMIVLADMGASKSVIGMALVKKHKLKIDPGKARVSLTNASGDKMSINGMVMVFLQPEGAPRRKMIRAIVSESVGNNFLLDLPDLKHLCILPEDFPRYRGETYTIHSARHVSVDLGGARITTDAGRNNTAGVIHWNNGASQEIFWDNYIAEGEETKEKVKATKANSGEAEMNSSSSNSGLETDETEVGESIDSQNNHNGHKLPEGLEDVEGLGDPEDEPKFPSNLDSEALKMCKRYNTVFCDHLKRGRYIKGAPMRINLVPEENRVKPLYQAVPRVVPLHWREEAEKIVRNLAKHDIIEHVNYLVNNCLVLSSVLCGQAGRKPEPSLGDGFPPFELEHLPRSPLLPIHQRHQEEDPPQHHVFHQARSNQLISPTKD